MLCDPNTSGFDWNNAREFVVDKYVEWQACMQVTTTY